MNPRDAFGVAVRVIGLIILCAAVLYFLSAIVLVISPEYRIGASPAWHYVISGFIGLVIGLYLLKGAPQIVRFAYSNKSPD